MTIFAYTSRVFILVWLTGCGLSSYTTVTRSSESEQPSDVNLSVTPSTVEPLATDSTETVSLSPSPPTTPKSLGVNLTATPGTFLQQVVSTRIFDVEWGADSQTLFYVTQGQNIAYEIVSGVSREVSPDELLQQTPELEILLQLPLEATRLYIAPSGDKALYVKRIEAATPQPDVSDTAELWFHDISGYSIKLGEMAYCGFADALWTPDEMKLIIPRGPAIDRCGTAYAWLVDLSLMSLVPLFPFNEYPIAVRTYVLSPDGQSLLFGTFGVYRGDQITNPLYLLDINDLSIEQLQTPDLAHGEQWLTDNKLLISYRKDSQIDLTLGLFDLETSEVSELTPMFNGLCIRLPSVSPNLRWLAFATGEDCDNLSDLWLMSLELDH
jgi:hypothetical protein